MRMSAKKAMDFIIINAEAAIITLAAVSTDQELKIATCFTRNSQNKTILLLKFQTVYSPNQIHISSLIH
jgi:hypothetical protein